METREAKRIRANRRRGEEEDDDVQEWEHVAEEVDFDVDEPWRTRVDDNKPDIKSLDPSAEVKLLQTQVIELTNMVRVLVEEKGKGWDGTE